MSMDVEAWLRSLGLDEYAGAFAENDIDGDTLIELTDNDLKEIGIASVGYLRAATPELPWKAKLAALMVGTGGHPGNLG